MTGRVEFTAGRAFYRGRHRRRRADRPRSSPTHPDIDGGRSTARRSSSCPSRSTDPLRYYRENVSKSVELRRPPACATAARRVLFSSSASIYQPGDDFAVDEIRRDRAPLSPYARTKAVMPRAMLEDAAAAARPAGDRRCATSTRSAPIRRCAPGCRLRQPDATSWAGCCVAARSTARRSRSPASTGRPATAPASATTSTCGTWRRRTSRRCGASTRCCPRAASASYEVINLGTGNGTTVRELLDAVPGRGRRAAAGGEETDPRPGDAVGRVHPQHAGARACWTGRRSSPPRTGSATRWSGQPSAPPS